MEIGRVTSVYYKEGGVYCDVRPIRPGSNYTRLPVTKSQSGEIIVPEQGQRVGVKTLQNNNNTRFISEILDKNSSFPDNMKEGEFAIQLDSETRLYFEENDDGDYDLHLDTSGDVFINGNKQ